MAHDELAASAGTLARGCDRPAMKDDQILDEREAEAEAAFRARDCARPLDEEVEDVREQVRADAPPRRHEPG
jgi:hypothetical protein